MNRLRHAYLKDRARPEALLHHRPPRRRAGPRSQLSGWRSSSAAVRASSGQHADDRRDGGRRSCGGDRRARGAGDRAPRRSPWWRGRWRSRSFGRRCSCCNAAPWTRCAVRPRVPHAGRRSLNDLPVRLPRSSQWGAAAPCGLRRSWRPRQANTQDPVVGLPAEGRLAVHRVAHGLAPDLGAGARVGGAQLERLLPRPPDPFAARRGVSRRPLACRRPRTGRSAGARAVRRPGARSPVRRRSTGTCPSRGRSRCGCCSARDVRPRTGTAVAAHRAGRRPVRSPSRSRVTGRHGVGRSRRVRLPGGRSLFRTGRSTRAVPRTTVAPPPGSRASIAPAGGSCPGRRPEASRPRRRRCLAGEHLHGPVGDAACGCSTNSHETTAPSGSGRA